MKIRLVSLAVILLCAIAPRMLFAFNIPPKPAGFVNDYANILKPEDKQALEQKLSNFEKATTNEISVVIIPSLDGDTVENVAQNIFTAWGIGKKDKNNGVLFLIAINDHKMRIHTGYGLEGSLTDIGTSYIQSDVVSPAFKAGDYAGGINQGVDKMIGLINGSDTVPSDYTSASTNSNSSNSGGSWMTLIFFGFIALQWIVAILARSKSWWAGGIVGGVVGIIILFFTTLTIGIIALVVLGGLGLLLDYFVSKNYKNNVASGQKPPWYIGGGGLGGGSSGGFGGFGGGSSGGGGSSSSW